MVNPVVRVTMLGEFTLQADGRTLRSGESRSRKSWLLLSYLIYHHRRLIPQEELIENLWGCEDTSTNPANALKTMFHRLRSQLGALPVFGDGGPLLHQRGAYGWDSRYPLSLDVEEFFELRDKSAAGEDEERLSLQLRAASLYRGDFLARFAAQPWTAAARQRCHEAFLSLVREALPALERAGRYPEAAALSRHAASIEPYSESIHAGLMRELIHQGDQAGAVEVYESLRARLFTHSGDMPGEELRNLYFEATRSISEMRLTLPQLETDLRGDDGLNGAFFCDYDFFRVLYRARLRDMGRSGETLHLCLLTVSGANGAALTRRSLDKCMENFKAVIRANLRPGDMFTACSVGQFALLLPRTTYENSCRVCERIIRAFFRCFPHSPAQIHYASQPLAP